MKVRKALSLVLALVMVLAMFSFASAATFEDVPSDLEGAVARLVGLGIINGYPDGTFRPDNNITRAEFAKIAVIVLGLEKSADLLENVPSSFKDVKVGDWYNKYVNVAANQGILKGYPDGTFRPNNNITQAEALTIVLRILGYKEEYLPGNWPYNYVTQADRIGLLDDSFATVTTATRGWIADLVSRALEVETVTVVDGEFQKGESLIKKSFGGQIIAEKRVVATLAASTGDTITIVDAEGKETTFSVAANAVINGAAFNALRNHMVDLTTKVVSGKEYVVTIDVLSTKLTGEVTKVNNLSRVVTISGTEVTFSESVQLPQPTDNISVYIYKGRVYYVEAAEAANAGVITDIILGAAPAIVFDYDALNPKAVAPGAVITLNGAKAALTDLAAYQYAVYELNDAGQITKLDAYSNVVIGKLEAWEMENNQITSITVNGVEYAAVKGLTLNAEIGVTVMLSLNHQNLVYSVIPLGTYASTVIGEFQSLSSKTSTEGQVYYIVLKDGTSYDITEAVRAAVKDNKETLFVDLDSTSVFTDLNVKDSTVKICYNAKGEVVAVYVFSPQTVIEKPAAGWADNSGAFNPDGTPKENGIPDVLDGKFAQGTTTYSKDGVPSATLVVEGPGVVVRRYVITWDAEVGKAKHIDAITKMHTGTVTGIGSDFRGKYVTIDVSGGTEGRYYFSEATESFYGTLNVGDKVEFTFNPAEDMWTGLFGTINKLNYLKVTKYATPTPPPSSGGPTTYIYQGRLSYDNSTWLNINGTWYRYVGTGTLPDLAVNDKVVVTFTVFQGETVIISISPSPTYLTMSADNVNATTGEQFTMAVTVQGTVANADKEHKVRFYGVIPGLTAENIEFAAISGGTPEIVTDATERGYAGASEGDLVLAWGPKGGFPLKSHDYSQGVTTQFKATIKKAGTYTVKFVFYDLDANKQINGANETATITVTDS